MRQNHNPITQINAKCLFLVWGTPDQGPRSRVMADKLGIEAHFVYTLLPRGALYVPVKYSIQAVRTMLLLFRKRPQVVWVQNPPLLAVFCVYFYCVLTRAGYVVDAHSEALLSHGWTAPPAWIKGFLARRAITTIITNERLRQMVNKLGGHALIIRDVPTTFKVQHEYPVSDKFNVALINTFAADEPLEQVLNAAGDLAGIQFYITGKLGRKHSGLAHGAPANVHFTDFLPDETYYGLLSAAQAVMCLTTRDHTMQRGACEALSLGKPIITSDWPMLRQYFNKGTVHVDNTAEGIRQGVLRMKQHYSSFESGIKELQTDQQREWQEKINTLTALIEGHLAHR
jgi:glycosyltransferase involved in cell wall biosynthesis